MSSLVIAAGDLGNVQSKVTSALQAIQGLLTAIVVIVGIVVALAIIIKRLPSGDDPREKSEVYHSVGRVFGLVALAAAVIWVVPAVYNLFT